MVDPGKKSTAFEDKERNDGSGKRDILFNRDGDKGKHGHVVQSKGDDGNTKYHYVRDEDGNTYIDDKKK